MKPLNFVLLSLFLASTPFSLYRSVAQDDTCSLQVVLHSFTIAQMTGNISTWVQRFADCENHIHLGAESVSDAYELMDNVSIEGLSHPCSREALFASFYAAALSDAIDDWTRIFSRGCPAPVPTAVNSLSGAYRMLTSSMIMFEPPNEVQGWRLPEGAPGTIEFTNSGLILNTEKKGVTLVLPVPGVVVDPQNFYLEVRTSFAHTASDQWIGFAFGDLDNNQFHLFTAGDIWDSWGFYYGIFTNDGATKLIQQSTRGLMDYDTPLTMALEGRDKQYALYVNDRPVHTIEIEPLGVQIGLAIINGGCCGSAGIMAVSGITVGIERE